MAKITDSISNALIQLIRFYQFFISCLIGPCCRFYPSCSQYSQQSFAKHGLIKGMALTFGRILRCHPWHPGGVDSVPE